MSEIRENIRTFILDEFLPGESPELLTDSTPLVTGGILDSIATMKLAAFLEERFHIVLQAHEMSVDHLNTVTDIVRLVQSKQK
ncbi:MAG: acyl carrier protein [Pirellulales bacterium]